LRASSLLTAEEYKVSDFKNLITCAIFQYRGAFERLGVEDRFGLSGKAWELVQHFGLTAEQLAERVAHLVERKRDFAHCRKAQLEERWEAQSEPGLLDAIECSQCHSLVHFGEFVGESPLAGDELCADCERRSDENCTSCRSQWVLSNPSFSYLCRYFRDVSVPC